MVLTFLIGIIGSKIYDTVDIQFSWASLLAYFTFTQNFYPPSWLWNPALWYMPVIIGLYAIFPLNLVILSKWGPGKLFLISILISYTTLMFAAMAGPTGNHHRDIFLFWTVEFSMGMILAYFRVYHIEKFRLLISVPAFIIGAGFFFGSWIMRVIIPNGKVFNDPVTSMGVFLILLNTVWFSHRFLPLVNSYLFHLSKQSYFIYLIHYPEIMFLIGPLFPKAMHSITVILLGGLLILAIYYLCNLVSKPLTSFSLKNYAIYDVQY